MSGIMNTYFYGKAGQGDYTVDQLPTTRRELFFTTLKVRFSSMIGLNLLHALWMVPVIIWLFIGGETALTYMDDDVAAKLIAPEVQGFYTDYSAQRSEYDAIVNADKTIEKLNYTLDSVRHNITRIENGEEVYTVEAAIVEGGEETKRLLTVEELRAQEAQLLEQISTNEGYALIDEEYLDNLKTEYEKNYVMFNEYRRQALNGNIMLSLLIMIPLVAIVGIGRTGQCYVLRNWARDEHAFMWQDYKAAIKANWKQGLGVGLINGVSFFVTFIAYITYGSMAATNSAFFTVPQMLMVVLLIVWWMANELIFTMMVTYDMRFKDLIRNSLIMVIARLPLSFVILLATIIVPTLILLLVPYTAIAILVLVVLYGVIGFSFNGFLKASYANSCFDKYLNPRIEGAKVNQGLHVDDLEDEEEPAQPEVEQKEDRFWEHKTK